MTSPKRTKVAVLGGGLGSLTAAFELTSTPELRERYELTVYQLGWRLGGKGASGRNAAIADRIQEHGLHMWMGWYQNAFRVIRACYDEWQPQPGCPFSTWEDAFAPRDHITFMDQVDGEWREWRIDFPLDPETPGDGDIFDHAWDYLVMLIEWVESSLQQMDGLPEPPPASRHRGSLVERLVAWLERRLGRHPEPSPGRAVHPSLHRAARLARAMPRDPAEHTDEHRVTLLGLLGEAHDWLEKEAESFLDAHSTLRRAYILMNLAWAIFRGLLAEGLPRLVDFSKFDDVELRAWLGEHGASETTLGSGVLRSYYDLAFAYEEGDFSRPALAAGSGLRGLLRMTLGYKGGVLWAMQAAMGDTIFTPLYDVLRARGVQFEFFRQVTGLHLGTDGRTIERIDTLRQVELSGPDYQPLVEVNGMRCWPSEPRWEQIVDGERLKRHLEEQGVSLESYWAELPGAVGAPLEHERDFDLVVFGLSQANLPVVCPELLVNERWSQSVEWVKTVQTQAVQLWLHPNRRALGWTGATTVLTSYVEPFSSWADMSHLVARERWPQDDWPGSIAYLCGAMASPREVPPPGKQGYPEEQHERVKSSAIAWLEANAFRLWPQAGKAGEFDWGLLVDLGQRRGSARLDGQYWRANIDPSERYVQTVPGSTAHRLLSDDPDFPNLYLAGDWVLSCINGGCVEGAVVGGMQASRAICGVPERIQGE